MEKLLASTISQHIVSSFLAYFQFPINWVLAKQKAWNKKMLPNNASKDRASKGEIRIVMDRLGILFDKEEDDKLLQESYDASELTSLFEVEEPSLEELKEAFDIFDGNKDGFVDVSDLQRVFCCLGLKEGSQVERCRRMIGAVKRDGDGRIDFDEFVMFMEKHLC